MKILYGNANRLHENGSSAHEHDDDVVIQVVTKADVDAALAEKDNAIRCLRETISLLVGRRWPLF